MENMRILYTALHADYYESDESYAEAVQLELALQDSMYTTEASSSKVSCGICSEDKESDEMFQIEGCSHSFCSDCISGHVKAKLEDNILDIGCLSDECVNLVELESVRSIIPSEVAARWEEQLLESSIQLSQKYYCPYADCSELLVDDDDDDAEVVLIVTESECPRCHRLFCAQCKVPWHEGFSCGQFERDMKREEEFWLLAERSNWRPCPHCRSIVEKIDGCVHITCRCKHEFCYICGEDWNETHFSTCREEED